MAKTKISEFDLTPANNTDIDGINIAEGCAPSGINNAIRELMSQLKAQQDGSSNDPFTVNGTFTAATTVITGGSINGTPIGASTASTGAFTTLSASGAATFGGATTFSGAVVFSSSVTANTFSSSGVTITGGSISGITDLAVADGGTGASTLTGVVIGNGTSPMTAVAPGTSGNVLTSNGSAWTSATPTVVKGLGIGGEVWNDVTSSRALNQTYTNSRGYPIMISVFGSGAGASSTEIFVNGTRIYHNNAQWNGAGAIPGGCLIIPNGATYSVSLASSLVKWFELY